MERGTVIIHNRIKCKNCGEVIESKSVHDWVCCSCYHKSNGKTGVFCDGGTSYLRWGGYPEYVENLTETRPFTDEEVDDYNRRQQELTARFGEWAATDLME